MEKKKLIDVLKELTEFVTPLIETQEKFFEFQKISIDIIEAHWDKVNLEVNKVYDAWEKADNKRIVKKFADSFKRDFTPDECFQPVKEIKSIDEMDLNPTADEMERRGK